MVRYDSKIYQKTRENLKEGDTIKFNIRPFVNLFARFKALDEQDRIWLILEVIVRNRKLKLKQTEGIKYIKV